MDAAEDSSSGLGVPYMNNTNNVLTIRAVGKTGQVAAESVASAITAYSGPQLKVLTEVAISTYADLQIIADQAISPTNDVMRINLDRVDPVTQKVQLLVTSLDEPSVMKLALTFPPSSLELTLLDETYQSAGRLSDSNPFYGGAGIDNKCTDGFTWKAGAGLRIITAGHCYAQGATYGVYTDAGRFIGGVYKGRDSNWQENVGTVPLVGGPNMNKRGDFALIEIGSGNSIAGKVFNGPAGVDSSSSRTVSGEWTTSPMQSEQFCTSGRNSGEICGWVTNSSTPSDIAYYNKAGNFIGNAKNMWVGVRSAAPCIVPGDSGGPVYTVYSNGTVQAKGIISGISSACSTVYGSLHDARNVFLGDVVLG